jgi:hypothetical protein
MAYNRVRLRGGFAALLCQPARNAALFRRSGHLATLTGNVRSAESAVVQSRIFGALSLALWIGVVVCACLNVKATPRVLLR